MFRAIFRHPLASSLESTVETYPRSRRVMAAAGLAITVSLFAVSGAQAQNCGAGLPINNTDFNNPNLIGVSSAAISAAVAATSNIIAANTAFLTQSTAFVSAPPNPQPGQEGGGVWVRGVGGELTLKSSQSIFGASSNAGTASGGCNTKFDDTYGGVQVGTDVARLNIDGWNLHLGTTAGAIWSSGSINGGSPVGGLAGAPVTQTPFDSTAQSPFVGTYVVATKGDFFFDALFRYNNYDLDLQSPGNNLFSQKLDAHGVSVSASAGYNYKVPNSSWFVEPSAGLIWSRTTVDPLNVNSVFGPNAAPGSGTVQINDIHSLIGRLGLRFGTTVESGNIIYQPFAAVSVWHDFDHDITANFQGCPGCFGNLGNVTGSLSTTNVGTFGQYSVGISGQIANTGWLGFVRLDYRNGDKLEGLSGTGGIRYQFTPEVVANRALPAKAPAYKAPLAAPVSWTGWYVGGIAGANIGRADLIVPGFAAASLHPSGVLIGGTLGYNYQIDRYVIGIEADGSWTNYSGSASCGPLSTSTVIDSSGEAATVTQPFFQTTCHDNMSWIATVAGRVGYLFGPRTLTYLKGGVAFGHETWSVSCNLGPLNGQPASSAISGFIEDCHNPAGARFDNISASDTRVGGTIGYGAEFALTQNWSVKGEFDWIDFGSKNLTASDGTVFTAKQWSVSEVKVGVNYHF
jgi:outer membrane autotransporter protein